LRHLFLKAKGADAFDSFESLRVGPFILFQGRLGDIYAVALALRISSVSAGSTSCRLPTTP
jgi:hypothetical protein